MAIAEALTGAKEAGRDRLRRFAQDHPQHPEAQRARALLDAAEFQPAKATLSPSAEVLAPPARIILRNDENGLADVPLSSMRWLPDPIDKSMPPVEPAVACSLPQVLEGAAQRAGEFTEAIERFTATEKFTHSELDATGAERSSYQDSFPYIATLQWPRPDLMILKEMRSARSSQNDAPPFQTGGLPAIGLVFHPVHAKDFQFTCEGLGHWRGQPAWQVRFEQRSDRPARLHDWDVSGRAYPASLKGRAWIAAASYHLLRVETDLVQPMPEIRLDLHHMTIEYAAVMSPSKTMTLWLPAHAEVYGRFRGRLFRQQHDFSNFVLFNVSTQQDLKKNR